MELSKTNEGYSIKTGARRQSQKRVMREPKALPVHPEGGVLYLYSARRSYSQIDGTLDPGLRSPNPDLAAVKIVSPPRAHSREATNDQPIG